MADLSINTNQTVGASDIAGNNLIRNADFESAPSFTAATNTNSRWIDGTAAGSTTNDTWRWAVAQLTGSGSCQFDSSVSHAGTNSLKVSTTAIASVVSACNTKTTTQISANTIYGIPVLPSTTYLLTFWMKTTANSGSATRGGFIRLGQYDTSGATNITNTDTTYVSTTTNWTQYTLSITTNASCNYINLQPSVSGNLGTATLIMDAWFDDITFYPVARQNGADLQVGPQVTPGIQDISGPKIWS